MNAPQGAGRSVEFIFTGLLGSQWQSMFDGFELEFDGQQTRATGHIVDQAALHGLLKQIRDMNLNLAAFRFLD